VITRMRNRRREREQREGWAVFALVAVVGGALLSLFVFACWLDYSRLMH
jgi:hypothetical protein